MKSRNHRSIIISFVLAAFIILGIGSIAHHVLAADATPSSNTYTPLALPTNGTVTLRTDLKGLFIDVFRYTIAASAALAIFMIILGGIQYMSTDAWSKKQDGKKRIQEALVGLILIITSFLILQTINPDIVNISLLSIDNKTADVNGGASGGNPDATKVTNWCALVFDHGDGQTAVKLYKPDCSTKAQYTCQQKTVGYWNNSASFCVAVFENDLTTGYNKFLKFDCNMPNLGSCERWTKERYLGGTGDTPGAEARWCVARFKDGKFVDFDCSAGTYHDCETYKKPTATGLGYSTQGTMTYPDNTTHTFNGCFQKYSLTGGVTFPDGSQGQYNGCATRFTTSGTYNGKAVNGCMTEAQKNAIMQ